MRCIGKAYRWGVRRMVEISKRMSAKYIKYLDKKYPRHYWEKNTKFRQLIKTYDRWAGGWIFKQECLDLEERWTGKRTANFLKLEANGIAFKELEKSPGVYLKSLVDSKVNVEPADLTEWNRLCETDYEVKYKINSKKLKA